VYVLQMSGPDNIDCPDSNQTVNSDLSDSDLLRTCLDTELDTADYMACLLQTDSLEQGHQSGANLEADINAQMAMIQKEISGEMRCRSSCKTRLGVQFLKMPYQIGPVYFAKHVVEMGMVVQVDNFPASQAHVALHETHLALHSRQTDSCSIFAPSLLFQYFGHRHR
jgi:hypothetical protein